MKRKPKHNPVAKTPKRKRPTLKKVALLSKRILELEMRQKNAANDLRETLKALERARSQKNDLSDQLESVTNKIKVEQSVLLSLQAQANQPKHTLAATLAQFSPKRGKIILPAKGTFPIVSTYKLDRTGRYFLLDQLRSIAEQFRSTLRSVPQNVVMAFNEAMLLACFGHSGVHCVDYADIRFLVAPGIADDHVLVFEPTLK